MNLISFYSHIDEKLVESQREYGEVTEKYIEARELYMNAMLKYEMAYANAVSSRKVDGEKVTVVRELAKQDAFTEYEAMVRAEHLKKRYMYMREIIQEKLNTCKALMRMKLGDAG